MTIPPAKPDTRKVPPSQHVGIPCGVASSMHQDHLLVGPILSASYISGQEMGTTAMSPISFKPNHLTPYAYVPTYPKCPIKTHGFLPPPPRHIAFFSHRQPHPSSPTALQRYHAAPTPRCCIAKIPCRPNTMMLHRIAHCKVPLPQEHGKVRKQEWEYRKIKSSIYTDMVCA